MSAKEKEIDGLHSEMQNISNLAEEKLVAFPLLFAEQVRKTPENTAVIYENRKYSYLELDALSESFKHAVLLQEKTNTNKRENNQEFCVGICINKSPEAIAAMLGILKAGAAFVPLDPEFPVDRIAYMVEDANISTIFVDPDYQNKFEFPLQKQLSDKLSGSKRKIHWIDCYKPTSAIDGIKNRSIDIKPSDLAYIMYTSGSTGKPKGVQIEHSALAAYCYADVDVYQVQENDRTLQFSTINFDIAIEEIFPPLITGSCVVIRPLERSDHLNELSEMINKYQITAVHIATAYWHEWVDLMNASADVIPESLRLMVVTGEKVSVAHYQRWKQLTNPLSESEVLWCNAYGPTEATVSASVFIPDEEFAEDNMPIGKPLKRYTMMIVDEHFKPLAEGETGQLLIGGPALARGYLNRPELNAEAFIYLEDNKTNKKRMYKTGDLARWHPDGNVEFAGRIDHQIKLGSYRIEPGEIEVVINRHEQVLESLITYDEVEGKKTLVAYVAIGEQAKLNSSLTCTALSSYLQNNLPAYMVPPRYILLSGFPKTDNGKIDRKALPLPSTGEVPRSSSFVAPRNELERELVVMWQEVLQLTEVSIYDDFFALGGSSLLAVGIVSRIVKNLSLELPVRDFFANPTIASQAKHIQLMQGVLVDDSTDQDNLEYRQRLPKIIPSYFKSDEDQLYAVHYQPPAEKQALSHAVLFCHPFGHEYSRSYRNLQQFSIHLAQAGFDSFRFDYAGTGNSSGLSSELTIERAIENLKAATDQIKDKSGCTHLSIIGVRMGAPLAIKAVNENLETTLFANLKNIIVWDPVVNGRNYLSLLNEFHDKRLTRLEVFRQIRKRSSFSQLFGHEMSKNTLESFEKLNISLNASSHLDNSSSINKVLVTSSDYLKNESGSKSLMQNWEHIHTDDSIYWHDSRYTESAFSSPKIFQAMMRVLKENF